MTASTDINQIGLLAIAMQQAHDSVQVWLKAQGKAGAHLEARQCPDWERFMAAKQAFSTTLEAVVRKIGPVKIEPPKCDTAVELAQQAKGIVH